MKDRDGKSVSVGDRVWFNTLGCWKIGTVRVVRPSIFHNVEEALVDTDEDTDIFSSWVSPGDVQKLLEDL